MDDVIVLSHVNKSYEMKAKKWAVADLSLSVKKGEFFSLVGPSGCGKSTILKMIAGLQDATNGNIVKPDDVSMVFQSDALLPWLTVERNVSIVAKMYGFSQEKVKEVTLRYIRMVGLEQFRKKYPRELSGGQRQRVGIARALAVETEVLLLDEPFSSLDPLTTDELHNDLLTIWKNTQKTVLMVSHLLEEAVILADRVGVMKEGTLKSILTVSLPRPRTENVDFFNQVALVKKILEN